MRFPGGPLLFGSLLLGLCALLGRDLGAELLPPRTLRACALVLGLAAVLMTRGGWAPNHRRWAVSLATLAIVLAGLTLGTGADRDVGPPDLLEYQSSGVHPVTKPWTLASQHRDYSPGWMAEGSAVRMLGAGQTLLLARSIPAPAQGKLRRLGPEDIQRVAAPPARLLAGYLHTVASIRARLLRRMDRLPSDQLSALLGALLLGDRRKLEYETKDLFTRTGTRHLLALSGLHLAVLFGLLLLPFLRFLMGRFPGPGGRIAAGLVMAAGLGIFVPLAGGAPSLWRASCAAGLGFLAPLRGRAGQVLPRTDGCALLGLALAWEVLLDPTALAQPGVQLTYLATFGLLTARGLLGPGDKHLLPRAPHKRWPMARALLASVPRLFRTGVRASLVASAATLPVLWTTFGETAPIGLIATPLVTPIITALLLVGGLCVLAPGSLVAQLAEGLRAGLIGTLEAIDRLPLTPLNLPPRPVFLVVLLGILSLLALRRIPGSTRPALLLAAVLLLPWTQRARSVRLQVLDVGHGTAAVLEVPQLGLIVFDGGSRDRVGVTRALQRVLWDREADRVVYLTTHTDRDHTGALPWLAERFEAKQWWGLMPKEVSPQVLRGQHRDPTEGRIRMHEEHGVRLDLLRGSSLGGNEGSRSLLVQVEDQVLVLWGDAEDEGALATLQHCSEISQVDLLLLPHHGRAGPAMDAILDHLQPQLSWASSSDGRIPCEEALIQRGIPLRVTTSGPLLWPTEASRFPPDP